MKPKKNPGEAGFFTTGVATRSSLRLRVNLQVASLDQLFD